MIPDTLADQIHVRAWTDPVIDQLGHDPRSQYVEWFWLSVLGPAACFAVYAASFIAIQGALFLIDDRRPTAAATLGPRPRGVRSDGVAGWVGRAWR